jgi:hypothetical protein
MNRFFVYGSWLFLYLFGWLIQGVAQDTSGKQTIEIVSAYKPVFRDAQKLNYSAVPLPPSSEKITFNYQLPVKPLYLRLVPANLQASKRQPDSILINSKENYLKIGYGNLRSPVIGAGLAFGSGKDFAFQVTADHFSQRGSLRVQRFTKTDLKGNFSINGQKHSLSGSLLYQHQASWLYARDSSLLLSKEDSLRKPYTTSGIQMSWRNRQVTDFGLGYNPSVRFVFFNDGRSIEKNMRFQIPLEFHAGKDYLLLMQTNLDFTFFNPRNNAAYTNHIYDIKAGLLVRKQNWSMQASVMPVWSGQQLFVMPDITATIRIKEEALKFIAGWKGSVQKNNYEALASINPWINQPLIQFNTRVKQLYGGLKGLINNQLQYQVQFGFQQLLDQPLFENSLRPSVFQIRREARLNSMQAKGELTYRWDQRLELNASTEINNYFGQKTEQAPWHLIPLRLNTSVSWKPVTALNVRADLHAWSGGFYKSSLSGEKDRLKSVIDLNTGVEYRFTDGFLSWIQFSNVLNNVYERWFAYPVFGFQIHAGIKLIFDRKLFGR